MVNSESASVLEPLAPLVREGYKTLAERATNGLKRWYSSIKPVHRSLIDGRLSSISLSESKPAPTLYAVTGGRVERRTLSKSGSLLEDCVSSALRELAALSDSGDAAGINLESFSRLFFAFDYATFVQVPEKSQAIRLAFKVAAGYYSANGRQEFVDQLNGLDKLRRITISSYQEGVCTEDGQLSSLILMASDNNPAFYNIIISLRLLYLAAKDTMEKHSSDLSALRERIMAVAEAKGISSQIPEDYWKDDSHLQAIDELLDKVSLHKGVETIIGGCNLPPDLTNLMEVLLLTKSLDTVKTGKVAIENRDKPYSDAIGIAELIA